MGQIAIINVNLIKFPCQQKTNDTSLLTPKTQGFLFYFFFLNYYYYYYYYYYYFVFFLRVLLGHLLKIILEMF